MSSNLKRAPSGEPATVAGTAAGGRKKRIVEKAKDADLGELGCPESNSSLAS